MSIKTDLIKEINAAVKRKKEVAKEAAREKTVAHCVSNYFRELQAIPDSTSDKAQHYLGFMAQQKLAKELELLFDRHCRVSATTGENGSRIEIHWSNKYVEKHHCEAVSIFDESSAFFQDAIERIE